MFCTNCGNKIEDDAKFCTNCGNSLKSDFNNVNNNNYQNSNYNYNNVKNSNNNVNSSSNNDSGTLALIFGICSLIFNGILGVVSGIIGIVCSRKETVPSKNGKAGLILGIIGIISSIIIPLFIYPIIEEAILDFIDELDIIEYVENIEDIEDDTIIEGLYSKEIFSGNSFTFESIYSSATFKFSKDSRFEVIYKSGETYVGTYEVYNGFNITTKANQIRNDSSVKNANELADDIIEVSNKMMEDNYMNTYLLWIKTDSGILQPFLIEYNENSNSGVAVNLYAAEQGSFTLN